MKEVTVAELKAMRDNNTPHQLIDVREQAEVDTAYIGGEHIPMALIVASIDKISRDVPVIIHCRSGGRSGAVVDALEKRFGFTNVHNLVGGITAWSKEIDPSVPIY
jgi:sulfur-carrier protein adenylyltransferase/sulfurtransferase